MRLKKPEPQHVQGMCVLCGVRKQTSNGYGRYKPICKKCSSRRIISRVLKYEKKPYCEMCGFIALHTCQLDIDHIDGNHDNNTVENLQTLCANCHRWKTHENGDHLS